ncbi:MAG: PilZ domain-containing protein [Xanthobacteraceae bacterium]
MSSPDLEQIEQPVLEERRQNPRHRLGRVATIKLGVGIAPRFVLVTNASLEGVRLQLNGVETFDDFVLLFHGNGGAARDGTYRVVWRQGQDVGAKFISTSTENA